MILDYPQNVRFKCVKCGLCCGDTAQKARHVLLLEREANDIAAATSLPISEFASEITDKQPYRYEMKKTANEGKCPFLKENRCTIYSKRPLICRFYPFGLQTGQNEQKVFYFTDECLGIGKGKAVLEADFHKLLKRANKRMITS